jgi:hypothetical protein
VTRRRYKGSSQVSLNPDIAVEVFVLERGDTAQAPVGLA